MTQWIMTCCNGTKQRLPEPLAWRLEYGLGSPCDSFWVKIPWTSGQEDKLADAIRLTVTEDGEALFTGVMDECECRWSREGCTAELSGRGMQALLLDNQAGAADFGFATQADILRRYVTPYGIALGEPAELPGVRGFSVASGSSCWKVLYQFARYYAGVTPRFNRKGELLLSGWKSTKTVRLDETAPVTELVLRDRRYGVLSQVTVKDVTGWNSQTQVNRSFLNRGGCCSRVMLMPKDTGYQTRRYNARFQLDRSAAELQRIEVTATLPFCAWPGDLVQLTRPGWSRNGRYRVLESTAFRDKTGEGTTLILGDPNAVL